MLDMKDSLIALVNAIEWDKFENSFTPKMADQQSRYDWYTYETVYLEIIKSSNFILLEW